MENVLALKSGAAGFVCSLLVQICPATETGNVTVMDSFVVSSLTNVTVAAGETLRIEYLCGDVMSFTKDGPGRLEVAVIDNPDMRIHIKEGTFAPVRPNRMYFADDPNVLYHIDATVPGSMTLTEENGTNFISELRDADGKTLIKSVPYEGRPLPYLAADGMNGLPVIDFGTLKNAGLRGYGAAMNWEWSDGRELADQDFCEYFFAWEDDPLAKTSKNPYRGPSVFGVASAGKMMTRDTAGKGLTASVHPSGGYDRCRHNNHLDGIECPHFFRIPDGPHVFHEWTPNDEYPYEDVLGLGFNAGSKSYGGFKLGEFIIGDQGFSDALRVRTQRYLIARWRGAQFSSLTIDAGATFDTSGNYVVTDGLSVEAGGIVTDWSNVEVQYVHAGDAARPVTGVCKLLPDRSAGVQDNLVFSAAAGLETAADTTGAVSRVEGVGTFTKTGAGTVLVGSLEGALTALDVQAGTLRVAPLEAPGVKMRLDASNASTLELDTGGDETIVGRWNEANGRDGWYASTNVSSKYSFDSSRLVEKPTLVPNALNGRAVINFGAYTTADFPDGDGSFLFLYRPSRCLTTTSQELHWQRLTYLRHAQNVFLVWRDRPETLNLKLSDRPVIGPSFFGAGHTWFRGLGGDGSTYPVHYHHAPNRVCSSMKLDGVRVSAKAVLPTSETDGWHVLDNWIEYEAGVGVEYIGCNSTAQIENDHRYVNADTSVAADVQTPSKKGVYGGLQIAEMVFFGRELPEVYRTAVAGALGRKWLNRPNVRTFDRVTLADGTALEMPHTQLCATNLAFGGSARLDAELILPEDAAVTVSGDADGFGTLQATSVTAEGDGTVHVTVSDAVGLANQSYKLFDASAVTGDFTGTWQVTGLSDTPLRASLAVRDGGVWLAFSGNGTVLTLR